MREKKTEVVRTKRRQPKPDVSKDVAERKVKNFETTVLKGGFVFIFLCLIGYLVYFNVFRAEKIIDNTYNKRIDALSNRVVRGDILDSNGYVLATTITDENGNEKRLYPYGNIFAHVVGINSNGKSGLEGYCNYKLFQKNISIVDELAMDLSGEKLRGNNVVTTLDADIQKMVYNIMGDYTGAAIVSEADTGRVLAMVSKPDFDPNLAIEDYDKWASYDSKDSVLLNRAIHGSYPPGSTFKMLMLLEYIKENSFDNNFNYVCKGVNYIDNYKLSCYDNRVHNSEDLLHAFANSCNGAFATIGCEIDIRRLKALAGEALFNVDYEFELGHNISKFLLDEGAEVNEIIATSIGQGKTSITPLHNLILMSAVANNGTAPVPFIVDKVVDSDGKTVEEHNVKYYDRMFSPEETQELRKYLLAVTTIGTADQLHGTDYPVYGKTGSAQFDSSDKHHSLFMGFAEIDDKKLAISIVIEGGRDKFTIAADIARQIFDKIYTKNLDYVKK